MRDGTEEWILIHIEMQGYDDPEFRERMFIYYYRILDKYQKKVTAIAIMTDDTSDHPTKYETSFIGTKLIYEFNSYKLKNKTPEDFANTDNPFAIVMEVAWYALKSNELGDEALYNFKIRLVRRLKELDYDSEKIRVLFNFIKKYVNFENSEINLKFEEQSNIIFKNQGTMGIVDAIIDDAKRQYIEIGKEEGIEIGEEKGIEIGKKEGIEIGKEEGIEIGKEEGIEIGKEEGIEIGKEEGIEIGEKKAEEKYGEERKNTIQNLKDEGFSNEKIATIIGISVEEVLRLLN